MVDVLVATIAGCTVFLLFMLVFIRRDDRGQRGGRLGGCRHHTPGEGCERCQTPQATAIHPHPIAPMEDDTGNSQNKADRSSPA
jgi:hypothetical protein